MNDGAASTGCSGQRRRARLIRSAPVILMLVVAALLAGDRMRYLARLGFVYTDADQTTLWYQAWDVAHGRLREPCFYGQDYGPAIEAWLAVPLLWMKVPAWAALPIVTTALGLLPFALLAIAAFRSGQRWAAPMVLLVPLVLPVRYAVVTALPRGFVNGLAVAAPAAVCWIFGRSRRSFFAAGLFSALALTTNLNSSILLLASGAYALLHHWRSRRFYVASAAGALAAIPAPLFLWWFYHAHPDHDVYRPKAPFTFAWSTLRGSFFVGHSWTLNRGELDMFFNHLVPGNANGWLMLAILPAMSLLLAAVGRFRGAVALLAASAFALLALGIERIHTGYENVFYPASRMYLALPVLFGMWLIWLESGLTARVSKWKFMPGILRAVLMIALGVMAFRRDVSVLNSPSPFVRDAIVPPVDRVDALIADTKIVADVALTHNATLALVGTNQSCLTTAGPVLSNGGFETIYPSFERRTFRIAEERTRPHTCVLLYRPRVYEVLLARQQFSGTTTVSQSPEILLIPIPAPGITGMNLATRLGIVYRSAL